MSVSATTRRPRPGEVAGKAYHFLSPSEFDAKVAAGDFIEHADYSGNRYGTLRSEVQRRLDEGVPVVLEIEVQGARQVRRKMPDAVTVFIAPPTLDALRTRLVGRGTDADEQVQARLDTAKRELEAKHEFDHVVVNDRLEEATEQLAKIVQQALRYR
jgi:guanylate kinase